MAKHEKDNPGTRDGQVPKPDTPSPREPKPGKRGQ
jgi:hypothetical protein